MTTNVLSPLNLGGSVTSTVNGQTAHGGVAISGVGKSQNLADVVDLESLPHVPILGARNTLKIKGLYAGSGTGTSPVSIQVDNTNQSGYNYGDQIYVMGNTYQFTATVTGAGATSGGIVAGASLTPLTGGWISIASVTWANGLAGNIVNGATIYNQTQGDFSAAVASALAIAQALYPNGCVLQCNETGNLGTLNQISLPKGYYLAGVGIVDDGLVAGTSIASDSNQGIGTWIIDMPGSTSWSGAETVAAVINQAAFNTSTPVSASVSGANVTLTFNSGVIPSAVVSYLQSALTSNAPAPINVGSSTWSGGATLNITAISGSGTKVTVTAANSLSSGSQVYFSGLTGAWTALNGTYGTVIATGLTSAHFEITSTLTGATSTGTATVALASGNQSITGITATTITYQPNTAPTGTCTNLPASVTLPFINVTTAPTVGSFAVGDHVIVSSRPCPTQIDTSYGFIATAAASPAATTLSLCYITPNGAFPGTVPIGWALQNMSNGAAVVNLKGDATGIRGINVGANNAPQDRALMFLLRPQNSELPLHLP